MIRMEATHASDQCEPAHGRDDERHGDGRLEMPAEDDVREGRRVGRDDPMGKRDGRPGKGAETEGNQWPEPSHADGE